MPHSNHAAVAAPRGLTSPLNVAPDELSESTASVAAVGAATSAVASGAVDPAAGLAAKA